MANFQTQEQWENDSVSQDIFSHTNETSHHRNNNHKKIYIITAVIFTLSLVIILSIYTFARSIEGTWIRQADDNIGAEGMTIEVIKHGGSFEGKVTSDSDSRTRRQIFKPCCPQAQCRCQSNLDKTITKEKCV